MKKNIIVLFSIFAILTFSGCAATKKQTTVPPGQLSLEEIMGTDTLRPKDKVSAKVTTPPAKNVDQSIIKRIEKLEAGQVNLQNNFDNLELKVVVIEERLNAFEKNLLDLIRESETIAKKKDGPDAYPSVGFTESKNAVGGFGLGSAEISPAMKQKINAIYVYISQKLSEDPGKREIKIEGWADNLGSDSYNRTLSLKRAEKTRDYFLSLLTPEQKNRLNIKVAGKGMCSQKGDKFRFVIFWIK